MVIQRVLFAFKLSKFAYCVDKQQLFIDLGHQCAHGTFYCDKNLDFRTDHSLLVQCSSDPRLESELNHCEP